MAGAAMLPIFLAGLQAIPEEVNEAAAVEGTSRLGTLLRVIVTAAAPGIAVAAVLVLPVLCVVAVLQRYLRPGALAGAVKG